MNPAPAAAPSSPPRGLSPRWWFGCAVLAGLLFIALVPGAKRRLGLFDHGAWFLDSYALLAANDAERQGLDPSQPNPLDVYGRPHSYSNWWFALGRLGFTRDDNFLVGGVSVLLFLAGMFATVRPRTAVEAGAAAIVALSPPVLLAVNRANNDLVVFAVLGLGLALARRAPARWLAGWSTAVAVATGLKFFPMLAAGAGLVLHPARRALVWTTVTAGGAALVLWSVRESLARAVIPVPTGSYLFGAPLFWRDIGWTGRGPLVVSAIALLAGAVWLARQRWTTGLAGANTSDDSGERLAFATGALLLVGCFLAGISFAYRWVFALWLLPWLWRRAFDVPAEIRAATAARFALGLLVAAVWMDGIYCATLNTFIGPMEISRLVRWETRWSLCSQPLVWILMLLLAGWLVELAYTRLRELRH
jgi:hypothetical protein